MPHIQDKGLMIVTLSPAEVLDAIEHKAWCAAVDNDPSIAVQQPPVIEQDGDGYRVTYTRKD